MNRSLHGALARLLFPLRRFSGVIVLAACAGACAPITASYDAGPPDGVAGIQPQILTATYVPGAQDFCRRNPRDCAPSAVVSLTAGEEKEVLEINRSVNHALTWAAPEVGQSGRTNSWQVLSDGGKGPCADFAVTKLDRMLQAGLPAGAFSFALVHVDGNRASVLHLVLVAKFRDGLYVLDSRDDRLWRPQEITDLAWLSYRSFGAPALWRPGTPNADLPEPAAAMLAENAIQLRPAIAEKPSVVLVASRRGAGDVRVASRRHGWRRRTRLG